MKLLLVISLNITLAFLNSIIIASEREGLGIAIEGGSFKPIYENAEKKSESSKSYGISIDYQWDITQLFTFSVIGFENGGKSSTPPKQDYKYYKSGFLGAGIKAWIGSFFIGIHFGEYYLTWIEKISSYTGIMTTGGNGFGLGFETKSGIIIAAYNENSGVFNSENMPRQKVIGDRFLLGYRW